MKRILLIIFALVLILGVLAPAAPSLTTPPRLNAFASWLAMRPVTVECLNLTDRSVDPLFGFYGDSLYAYVEGEVDAREHWHPHDTMRVHGRWCHAIRFPYKHTLEETAVGIATLTHEAGHLRGHRWSADEAKTECWAIRHFRYAARYFGYTDEFTLDLMYAYALKDHNALGADYQLPGCVVPAP